MTEKISVGIWAFGVTVDRVTTDGYKDSVPIEKRFELASKVDGITGIEMHYPTEFVNGDADKTKKVLEKYGFKCSNVMIDIYKRKWKQGALVCYDDKVFKDAVELSKEAIDASVKLGANQIGICPTHDGYDYPFQCDFKESYDRFVKGLREIAEYNPKVKIGIEYKPRETRAHIITRTVDRALILIDEIKADNVGILIDVGHALFGQENPAESAYVASRYGKLYHLHLNDNHGIWDDDLTFGTVHFWHLLEFITWLKYLKYDGWYSFDIYPYREDPVEICTENVQNLKQMMELASKIDMDTLIEKTHNYRTSDLIKHVREQIFK